MRKINVLLAAGVLFSSTLFAQPSSNLGFNSCDNYLSNVNKGELSGVVSIDDASVSMLKGIYIDGVELQSFDANKLDYSYEIAKDAVSSPVITVDSFASGLPGINPSTSPILLVYQT